jgi:hypothetical protein
MKTAKKDKAILLQAWTGPEGSSDTTGKWNCDLPAYSAVPQPTALPCAQKTANIKMETNKT